MQGSGWTKVVSKRPNFRWDIFPFGGRNRVGSEQVTSFYVSEFPDYFNAKRLFELFGCSGSVVEVAISPRRNRLGRRFAFARFTGVEDGRILAIRLDNILIEGKKIHVNLPRFGRDHGVVAGRRSFAATKGTLKLFKVDSVVVNIKGTSAFRGGSCSYTEVVGNNGRDEVVHKGVAFELNFHSNKDSKSRFEKAYVSRVCILGTAYNIQNYLEMEGIFAIKVTPLGGNCCLLEDREVGFISDLIKEGETWWKSWFSEIKRWEAGIVDGSRDVWFRIYGIPLHVWCSEFFMLLGEKWGRFICTDEHIAKGEMFDVARILVSIPLSLSIPDIVSVCIDGAIFDLCIREDPQSIYRHAAGNSKGVSSDEESSESDIDRLLLESDSACSGDSVGSKNREIQNSACVGSVLKEVELSKSLGISRSGGASDVGGRGRAIGHKATGSDGICNPSCNSDSMSDPDALRSADDNVFKVPVSAEVSVALQLNSIGSSDRLPSNLKVQNSGSALAAHDIHAQACSVDSGEAVSSSLPAYVPFNDIDTCMDNLYSKSDNEIWKERGSVLVSADCKFLARSTVSCPRFGGSCSGNSLKFNSLGFQSRSAIDSVDNIESSAANGGRDGDEPGSYCGEEVAIPLSLQGAGLVNGFGRRKKTQKNYFEQERNLDGYG